MDKKWLPLALFAAVALLFGAAMWQGAQKNFDDQNYLLYGRQLLNGTYTIQQSPYAYGTLFIATIAGGLLISGGHAWGASIPQIIEYILVIWMAYACLLKYFDWKVSLTASLCAETSAFGIMYATRVLPDMLLSLLIATTFLILIYKPKQKAWMFIAGFMSGACVFVKFGGFVLLILLSPILIMLICIAIGTLIAMKRDARAIFLTGLLAALAIYQLMLPHGASLLTMAHAYDALQASLSHATLTTNLYAIWFNLAGYLPPYFNQIFPLGALAILSIMGTLLAAWRRDTRFYFAVAALWMGVGYMYLGTETLATWTWITTVSRYFVEFMIPMTILAAIAIEKLSAHKYKLITLMAILIISVASNVIPYLIATSKI